MNPLDETAPPMPEPEYPWSDLGRVWWGALISGGRVYGLIRRTPSERGVSYEVFDRRYPLTWRHDREGAGRFTGIGGVTDAEPISEAEGERLLAEFIAAGPLGEPDLR